MRGTMKRLFGTVLLVAIAGASSLGATACVGGKTQISAEDKERLRPYILDAVPADAKKVDINFENKIHLVGYKLEPELAPPGTPVKITYYWRCDEPIDDGWQLFTHIQHEGFDKPDNLDGAGPLREIKNGKQVLGPDRWERGKIYADEQSFTMPADLRGPDTLVYVGIWKGDARLRIVSGPSDGDNRAIVAKIKTGVSPKKPAAETGKRGANDIPQLEVMKLAKGEKIVVDGKGDDAAWGAAASTGPFVDVGTGRPSPQSPVQGSAKVAWDDDNVYFLLDVKDANVSGYFTTKDAQPNDWTVTGQPKTWEHDTAEIMIDPDGDGDNVDYYEIQIGPQNRGFHSQFDAYNKPSTPPAGPFGHEDWDPKLKSAVVVKGTMDKPEDKDEGYTIEVAIPWAAFKKGAKQLPPKPGDAWRVNMYAMENNGGTAWSPILGQGNFHKASRFGRLVFVSKDFLAARADAGAPDAGTLAISGTAVATDAGAPSVRPGPAVDGGRGSVGLGGRR